MALARRDGGLACRLFDETDAVLVEGGVTEAEPAADIGADATSVAVPSGDPLPISSTCFACGIDNPLGLRVRLPFDDVAPRRGRVLVERTRYPTAGEPKSIAAGNALASTDRTGSVRLHIGYRLLLLTSSCSTLSATMSRQIFCGVRLTRDR